MKQNVSVNKIMSANMITIHHGDTVSTARQLMEANKIHHMPIVSGTELIGLVTMRDIMRVAFSTALVGDGENNNAMLDKAISLEEIMVQDLQTIKDTDTIKYAAQILAKSEYNSLPVTNEEKVLKGIVTTKDLITYLVDQY